MCAKERVQGLSATETIFTGFVIVYPDAAPSAMSLVRRILAGRAAVIASFTAIEAIANPYHQQACCGCGTGNRGAVPLGGMYGAPKRGGLCC